MKKIFFAWLLALLAAVAPGSVSTATASELLVLERAPNVQGDKVALQRGARTFINYCLGCHGVSFVRYSKLQDLGLTKDEIEKNLMFTAEKIGEPIRTGLRPTDGKPWFGVVPPDLSIIARARSSEAGSGADWLYTYLRSFYHDPARPTGWNNVIFENVGMPHALWQEQGVQQKTDENGHAKLTLVAPGTMSAKQYDDTVADLVGFLVWASEPEAGLRKSIGIGVLVFLAILLVFAYALKKEYWKDVH